jgi:hypothetical protein
MNALPRSELSLLPGYQTGMSEDIDAGFDRGTVCARMDRLHQRFSMGDHDHGAQGARLLRQFGKSFRRDVRQFDARQRDDIPSAVQFPARRGNPRYREVKVRGIGVIAITS